MRRLFLRPLDVLLFRDARPFTAGEQFLAEGEWMPSPLTVQGALRTVVFLQNPPNLKEEIGDADTYGRFRMVGPFLAKEGGAATATEYFPVPADVAMVGGSPQILRVVDPQAHGVRTSAPCGLQAGVATTFSAAHVEPYPGGWFDGEALVRYLGGRLDGEPLREEDRPPAVSETRTGLRLGESSRTAEPGQIYTIRFWRLRPGFGFTVDAECDLLPGEGLLRLGRKGRMAAYRTLDARKWSGGMEKVLSAIQDTGRLKLYLATPAVFDKGWLPSFVGPDGKGEIDLPGGCLQVSLRGAAVPRHQPIGGWDLAGRKPRPLHRAVPAGSVYFFSVEGDCSIEMLRGLVLRPLSDRNSEVGFGTVVPGVWRENGGG